MFSSPTALAGNLYYGANISFLEYTEDLEAQFQAIHGTFGYRFNENFSAEFRAGTGIGDDTDTFSVEGPAVNFEFDVTLELKNFYGAYVKAGAPVNDFFSPYVFLGYTSIELALSGGELDESASDDDSGFGFDNRLIGVGADIRLSSTLALNLEYASYYDKNGGEIDGFGVGLLVNF